MTNIELAKSKLKKYNQQQIIEAIDTFSDKNKGKIANQIVNIDFEEMKKLYEQTKIKKKIILEEITPINYIDKKRISQKDKEELESIGQKIIKNNQYAVVTMAGGQGTRLGWNGPKGTYRLNIGDKGKYIFEVLVENLSKAKRNYDIYPYWYIMTSRQNNDETMAFFEEHDYFGYDKEKVKFFEQGELPLLTKDGKIVIENNQIKTGSNGNGGVYQAMKNKKVIDDMKNKGINWIYICGVDNIMVNPIDPLFIGLTIKHNMQVASKSVVKAYPEERVGVFCKRNGKPSTIEYIEMTENMKEHRDEEGELIYGEANFVSHLLNLNAIERIANQNLKYHLAIKNNLYKFETFIFDGFEYLDDMLVMRVDRDEEFAPIKNKEGKDSPKTATEIYERNAIKNART